MKTLHFGFIFNSLSAFSVFVFVFTTLYLLLSIINVPTAFASVVFDMPTDGGTSILSWGTNNSYLGLSVGETIFPSGFPEGFSGVCKVSVWIGKVGNVSDDVTLKVYYEQSGSLDPDDQQLISQASIHGSELPETPDEETTFHLDQCTPHDKASGTFWYVLSRSQPNGQGSYLAEVTQTGQYPSMFFISEDDQGIWTQDNTKELRVRLETKDDVLDKEPVIFIPGILGTRLNNAETGEEVWPNARKMIGSKSDDFLNDLALSNTGEDLTQISVSQVFEEADVPGPINIVFYRNIISELESLGYKRNNDLILFSYDWRKDITLTSDQLFQKISELSAISPIGTVKIVAHSLGGVLTDHYINSGNNLSQISQVILIGTPHLGAPKTFKALNYGDDFDIGILNSDRLKHISQNMPSVYQLLPSREYIDKSGGYLTDYRQNRKVLDFDETVEFMKSDTLLPDHRNPILLDSADIFHQNLDSQNIDNLNVINIVGCNQLTFSGFKIFLDQTVGIKTTLGDGTVPLVSAKNFPGSALHYYVNEGLEVNHLGLVKDETMTRFIGDLVEGTLSNDYDGISSDESPCFDNLQKKSYIVSTHSPVNLHTYDNVGNHTGLDNNGDIELSIPGSDFFKLGEESFVILPDGDYRFLIEAYATGSFDFDIEELIGTETTSSDSFSGIQILNPNLKAELDFTDLDSIKLKIDETGDGSIDNEVLPDSEDQTPPTIDVSSPTNTTYTRNQIIPVQITVSDNQGSVSYQTLLDGILFSSSSIDLYFYPLGSHSFEVIAKDHSGNQSKETVSFQSIATVDSLIADIERSYQLGYITTLKSKNDLITKVKLATKINYVTEKAVKILPDGSSYEYQVITAQKTLNKLLIFSIYYQLEWDYKRGVIKKEAYDILREDVDWINR